MIPVFSSLMFPMFLSSLFWKIGIPSNRCKLLTKAFHPLSLGSKVDSCYIFLVNKNYFLKLKIESS
jgi:hypothetical protein